MDAGFRADPIVANKVIVEIRSAGERLGSPINLHVVLIQDGITCIVNGLEEVTLGKPHDATV